MNPAPRTIDAHLHLWDRAVSDYAWITPSLGQLFADFGPAAARAELDSAGIDAAVLVQADDSAADTHFMLDIAREHDWVAGVVGWIPLDDPMAARAALEALGDETALCGIRHLVHAPTWAVMRSCLEGLSAPEREAVLGGTAARVYRLDTDLDEERQTC